MLTFTAEAYRLSFILHLGYTVSMSEQSLDSADATEKFLGLAEDVDFDEAIAKKLANEDRRLGNKDAAQDMLDEHGVAVDVDAAPAQYRLAQLQPADWENARNSDKPLLTLYAASNLWRQEQETTFIPAGSQFPKHQDPRLGYAGLHNRAMIASLPLVHGLSAAAFVQLAETNGSMQSNKNRYKQSGADALTFHSAGVGATNLEDRQLGLDQYIFFDYGRPAVNHRQQPEITLVVDPSVVEQAGAFMTEQDYADTLNDADTYMNGATTPEYFKETALLRIHNSITEQGETRSGGYHTGYSVYNNMSAWQRGQDGDFNRDGYPRFSTYEVKISDPPGVAMDAVHRVIVRDEATFNHLQETLGDRFEFIYEPRLRAAGERIPGYPGDPRDAAAIDQGNYPELLQVPGLYEQKMAGLIEADFRERSAQLDALPDDEKELVVVAFGTSDSENIGSDDITKRFDEKTNMYNYSGTRAVYPSVDALYSDVQDTYDYNGYDTVGGQEPWFYNPYAFNNKKEIATPSGTCIVATVERSRRDPTITRVVGARSFSLDELSPDVA